ncbi:DegV family protein [soil metagenome]
MSLAIVTDSMTSFAPGVLERPDVRMVPLTFHFGTEESYRDKVDLTDAEFYSKLEGSKVFPTTAQPAAGEFVETYESLSAYDDLLVLTSSAKISGTYNSAISAADMVDRPVQVMDMRSAEIGSGLILNEVLETIDGGGDLDEALEAARSAIARCRAWFAVGTLEYLQRGGRIGRAQRLAGTALDIRPVLTLEDGEIVPHKRTRGRKRQMSAMIGEIQSAVDNGRPYSLGNANAPEPVAEISRRLGGGEAFSVSISGVIGCHVGPGAYGVAYL